MDIVAFKQEFDHLLFQQFAIIRVHGAEFFSLISMVCLTSTAAASLEISLKYVYLIRPDRAEIPAVSLHAERKSAKKLFCSCNILKMGFFTRSALSKVSTEEAGRPIAGGFWLLYQIPSLVMDCCAIGDVCGNGAQYPVKWLNVGGRQSAAATVSG